MRTSCIVLATQIHALEDSPNKLIYPFMLLFSTNIFGRLKCSKALKFQVSNVVVHIESRRVNKSGVNSVCKGQKVKNR